MSISVIKNPLSESLMPFDKQLTKSDEPLPITRGLIYLDIGRKGSGKSTLLINLIKLKESPFYNIFNQIFLISPSAKSDDKFKFLLDEIEPEGKYYNTCNEDVIEEIIEKVNTFNKEFIEEQMKSDSDDEVKDPVFGVIKKKKKLKKKAIKKNIIQPSSLLIMDDCLHALPKSNQRSKINELFTTSRHKKLTIFITSQKYLKLNTIIRCNTDLLTVFHTDNKQELESIVDDWALDKDKFKKAYDFATEEPYSFLHISFFGNKPLFFKKYDRINFS